jgi:CMP-N,N'-diacetyllegionaminic acid synthase
MLVYALILARSGSKTVADKNIRDVAGHPLFSYSIAFAKKIPVNRIIVSTDSESYQRIALHYGAECPYLRGECASTDSAADEHILEDLDNNLPRLGIPMPDLWVRLKPTTPFRTVRSVEAAIAALHESPELDSVRIISRSESRLHVINRDGYLEPFHSTWDPNRSIMLRSEFPVAYNPFNLAVFRHSGWLERGANFMGRRIKPIIEHKITGVDIDDMDDLELVKALTEARPRPAFLQQFIHDP